MKAILLFIFLVFTQIIYPQSFTEVPPFPSLEGMTESAVAFADVDGDNDQDVIIIGEKPNSLQPNALEPFSKQYVNDGMGNYTEKTNTLFADVSRGSIAFADVDGDNDQDVIITGENKSFEFITKLYTNDGTGDFTELMGTTFSGVRYSSIALADVDGDNDPDVLITGEKNNSFDQISKLYINDGLGNFTELTGTTFDGVSLGSVAFADVDGDNDQDVLITGQHFNAARRISKIYTNDGLGNFTELTGTPFDGVAYSSVAFEDVDGDNDQDVLITGLNILNSRIAKLYTNDGLGNFTELTNNTFAGVADSSIAFFDVNNDNDQDVIIVGMNNENEVIAKLYTNDGLGNFVEMMNTSFTGVKNGSITVTDVDGDNDLDVIITGQNITQEPIADLFTNDGFGNFTELQMIGTGTSFNGVKFSAVAFTDVDGDNDQDVLITGQNNSRELISELYFNDGLGNFTQSTNTPFDGVAISSIGIADVDNDSDQDLLITGEKNNSFEKISKLYINDGLGNFTELRGTPFDGVSASSVAFADVDGDNDHDVLITGAKSGGRIATLYTNDGLGNFTEILGTPFDGVEFGSIAFSDIDGDNDQDVLITGENSRERIAKLYTNDGLGNFIEIFDAPFEGVAVSSIAFADVDGDNHQDVLITGLKDSSSDEPIATLYTNDGFGNFTEMAGTTFQGVWYSSIAFRDVDGDNDQDVLITGLNNSEEPISKLYINDGFGNFAELIGTPFDNVEVGSIGFADVDGDNDQDVLITGLNSFGRRIAKLYTNDGIVSSIDNVDSDINLDVIVFPNPSQSSTIYLKYNSTKTSEIDVKIYNTHGVLLSQQEEFASVGQQIFSIDIKSLAKGNYFMELDNGNSKEVAQFIVK